LCPGRLLLLCCHWLCLLRTWRHVSRGARSRGCSSRLEGSCGREHRHSALCARRGIAGEGRVVRRRGVLLLRWWRSTISAGTEQRSD
jgi:hypothetical protein